MRTSLRLTRGRVRQQEKGRDAGGTTERIPISIASTRLVANILLSHHDWSGLGPREEDRKEGRSEGYPICLIDSGVLCGGSYPDRVRIQRMVLGVQAQGDSGYLIRVRWENAQLHLTVRIAYDCVGDMQCSGGALQLRIAQIGREQNKFIAMNAQVNHADYEGGSRGR